MALANLPDWTITPNWNGGVLERLEWLSSVLRSPSGAEQRFGLRLAPRRTFELSLAVGGAERTRLDLSIGRVGQGEWYMPLWHDGTRLNATAASGAVTLAVDTLYREFRTGGAALLRDSRTGETERVEIAAVAFGSITLADGLGNSWPVGSRLYPMRRARMLEPPKLSRRGSAAMVGTVRFQLTEPDDWAPYEWTETYLGAPVLSMRPDESNDLTMEYQRLVSMFDDSLAPPAVVDTSDLSFTIQQHSFWAAGRAEHYRLRSILYALRGKVVPAWLPTHYDDLQIAASSSGVLLVVKGCGFTEFGGPRFGREHIRIERRDGTASHHDIQGAMLDADGTERLVIAPPLSAPLTVAGTARVCFMALARLDQDNIEIAHATDQDGLATMTAAFRSTPETRDPTPWSRTPYLNPAKTAWPCGVTADCDAEGLISKFIMSAQEIVTTSVEGWPGTSRMAVQADQWTAARVATFKARAFDIWNPDSGPFGTGTHRGYGANIIAPMRSQLTTAAAGVARGPTLCGHTFMGIVERHAPYSSIGTQYVKYGVSWGRHLMAVYHSPSRTNAVDMGYHRLEMRDASDSLPALNSLTLIFEQYPVEGGDGWITVHHNGAGATLVYADPSGSDPFPWYIPLDAGVIARQFYSGI
jgi:hypothetical protein